MLPVAETTGGTFSAGPWQVEESKGVLSTVCRIVKEPIPSTDGSNLRT
jgi:hypothetical protein